MTKVRKQIKKTTFKGWITLRSYKGRILVSLPPRSSRRRLYTGWWTEVR